MENKRVEDKIDKIMEDVADIKITMARNTTSLEVHMKRSDLLEQKLVPVEQHVSMMNGALKLLGVILTVAAIIEMILRLQSK